MANELEFYGADLSADTGLTIVARVYDQTGTQVGADVPTAEVGSLAIYIGDMPTAPVGRYGVRFLDGTTIKAQNWIDWDGTAEITPITINAKLDALQLDATAILTDTGELQANQGDWATATGFATQASVDALPNAAAINAEVDAALADYDGPTKAELGAAEANIIANAGGDATAAQQTAILSAISGLNDITAADVWAAATRTLTSYPDATLSAATLSAIATAVEQAILNEGDGQQVLNAIVGAIGNTNVDEVALVAAIRADLERVGGAIDNLPDLAEMEASAALTASGATPAAIAAEIVSGSQGKVPADIQCVAGQQINGSGTKADPWGP